MVNTNHRSFQQSTQCIDAAFSTSQIVHSFFSGHYFSWWNKSLPIELALVDMDDVVAEHDEEMSRLQAQLVLLQEENARLRESVHAAEADAHLKRSSASGAVSRTQPSIVTVGVLISCLFLMKRLVWPPYLVIRYGWWMLSSPSITLLFHSFLCFRFQSVKTGMSYEQMLIHSSYRWSACSLLTAAFEI